MIETDDVPRNPHSTSPNSARPERTGADAHTRHRGSETRGRSLRRPGRPAVWSICERATPQNADQAKLKGRARIA